MRTPFHNADHVYNIMQKTTLEEKCVFEIQRRLAGKNMSTGRLAFIGGRTGLLPWLDGWGRGTLLSRAGGGGGVSMAEDLSAVSEDVALVAIVVLSFLIRRSWSLVLDGSDSLDSCPATRFLFGTKTSAGLMVGSIGCTTTGLE